MLSQQKSYFVLRFAFVLCLCFSFIFAKPIQNVIGTAPTVIRVVPNGQSTSTCGSTWATACDLQYALQTRADTSNGATWEVWVKTGTYYTIANVTNLQASFQLKNGVSVFGGFSGSETDRSQRNWQANQTILSGDIYQDDKVSPARTYGDVVLPNAYHVVTSFNNDPTAVLDGFTITAGYANGEYPGNYGGGIYIEGGNPTLMNLVISGNEAFDCGGGIALSDYKTAGTMLTNIVFTGNSSEYWGGGLHSIGNPILDHVTFNGNFSRWGGAMYSSGDAIITNTVFNENHAADTGAGLQSVSGKPRLTQVSFIGNQAWSGYGGGIYNKDSDPILTNVTFSGNYAYYGGAFYNYDGNGSLVNVTFDGNEAYYSGGAFYNTIREGLPSSPMLVNVTMTRNKAQSGGGIFVYNGSPILRNSILWANEPTRQVTGNITTSYSDIQTDSGQVFAGQGNINQDPKLGSLGDNGGATKTVPFIAEGPAVDAVPIEQCTSGDGVNPLATDQRGIARPQGKACDMGAYEAEPWSYIYLPVLLR